ncbi:MAG: exodeoxyribonuclease VII large subunit [Bacteroidales bacterium]|nr:exodeoxyribonuclease VII large subunit [Bacteroidales bacterium]HOO66885.1 exodeoxyribonuclease VII large subunit [Bacteroidales bacterium]HPE22834.1 exodeoxyribonuclease VII large subunit [Bacteroidales bacterium]HPJ05598.1 exodeoxyribonuclease VII large subunit [Bacteroidales bacterium]HRW27263.1 exodeoxyribonuclease VII large subunit [Bacteroidales bacterium]
MTREGQITLTELQGLIRDKIYEALPGAYWVIAEIADMKVHTAGHCYLELTGTETPGGKVTARARATIWASKFRSLNTYFNASTGIPLRAGITILFRATVEYHELYGLSLNITDIDPAYTAGDMALRREAIIRRLTAEGVLSMNSGLPLTPYPRNIAVISSSKAAGYQDFINHLVNNPYGYAFRTTLFEAVMQGETTMASVTEALDSISEMISEFDVVVIIRGGGSTIDLSWFDSYEIAYHVTQFPLPVLTGIGHEKDQSVTDMVAWKALKTPTAVAGFIVERTMECENNIIGMAESLVSAVEGAMEAAEERLSSIQNRITATARLMVRLKEEKLSNHAGRLARASANVLNRAKEATDRMEDALRHLNPAGVLRRGFTLTSRNGTIIQSASELKQGDTIKTYFAEGTAESMVEKINKKN